MPTRTVKNWEVKNFIINILKRDNGNTQTYQVTHYDLHNKNVASEIIYEGANYKEAEVVATTLIYGMNLILDQNNFIIRKTKQYVGFLKRLFSRLFL